ncbi:MAG: hypothetical protein AAF871_02775 [Pseudomonadota bacterium]
MDPFDLVGAGAAVAVVLAFYAKDPVWLRRFAISSNVLFVIYAIELQLWPILLLHAALLPLNMARLAELPSAASSVEPHDEVKRHRILEREMIERDLRLGIGGQPFRSPV